MVTARSVVRLKRARFRSMCCEIASRLHLASLSLKLMELFHGTSRVFDEFDAGEQAGGQLGSAFYFTDTEEVAENFAVFRHPPEMRGFDSQGELDAFLAERPDWALTYQHEVGGKIVASFATPEFKPQVIAAEVSVERPLALDEPVSDELRAAARRAGIPDGAWATADELWRAGIDHFGGGQAANDDEQAAANGRLLDLVRQAGHDAVNRPDERNGVAHRTWIIFDPAKIRIVSRRDVE
jgi:hypothetical protein